MKICVRWLMIVTALSVSQCLGENLDTSTGHVAETEVKVQAPADRQPEVVRALKEEERAGKLLGGLSNCAAELASVKGSLGFMGGEIHIGAVGQARQSQAIDQKLDKIQLAASGLEESLDRNRETRNGADRRLQEGLRNLERRAGDLIFYLILMGVIDLVLQACMFGLLVHMWSRSCGALLPVRAEKGVAGEMAKSGNRVLPSPAAPAAHKAMEPEVRTKVGAISKPELPPVPSMEECLAKLLEEAASKGNVKPRPVTMSACWHLGAASLQGHVRERNEDYLLGFSIGRLTCQILLDGCGGEMNGAYASYLAGFSAARFLMERLTEDQSGSVQMGIAVDAIRGASEALAQAAARYGADGLATTLAIVVADPAIGYFCTWLGDGDVSVVRADNTVQAMLIPHRGVEGASNVLTGWVGTEIHGDIRSTWLPACPGDVLIGSTDGLADRRPPNFHTSLASIARKSSPRLQNAVEELVQRFVDHQDDKGWVLDDNVSLFVIAGKEERVS